MMTQCSQSLTRHSSFFASAALLFAAMLGFAAPAVAQVTETAALWTFEGGSASVLVLNGPNSPILTPGPGVYPAQSGTRVATSAARGVHATSNSQWTLADGNGSNTSWNSNRWSVGDYYQFDVDASGYTSVTVSVDVYRNNNGPQQFMLQYFNGAAYVTYATVGAPSGASWSTSVEDTASRYTSTFVGPPATVSIRVLASGPSSSNNNGNMRVDNIKITGTIGCPTITVTTQPQPQGYCSAVGSASFSIVANNAATYQWRRNGANIDTTANPTAATANLILTNPKLIDAGSYDCVLGQSCDSLTVTSNAAALTVGAPAESTEWTALGSGSTQVLALAALPDGDLLVGGSFTTAGGVPANSIARYTPTTGVWSALGTGITTGNMGSGFVTAIAVLLDGDVLVGGAFTTAGGVPAKSIARYNPTTGVWSALGEGVGLGANSPGAVRAMAVLPSGDVIVGGDFTTFGGVFGANIARYNPSTGAWSEIGSLSGSPQNGLFNVTAMTVVPDGSVIVGGLFTLSPPPFGGIRITRYSPASGEWSSLGTGTNDGVLALTVLPGGDVLAGGFFTSAGGVPANSIARYNPTTGVWSALGAGTLSFVRAFAVLPGGDVVVGGDFTTAGGKSDRNRIARYSTTTGIWSPLGAGVRSAASSNVFALAALQNDDVFVGGSFTMAGEVAANSIARLSLLDLADSTVCRGTQAQFSVSATGALPFSYSWQASDGISGFQPLSNGVNPAFNVTVSGTSTPSLLITPNLSGPIAPKLTLRCQVTNSCFDIFIAEATLTISSDTTIAAQPASRIICPTLSTTLTVAPAGPGPFTYQWQWRPFPAAPWFNIANGLNIDPLGASERFSAAGALASTLNVSNASGLPGATVTGWENRCIVTAACGSVTSSTAMITICAADFNCSGGVEVSDIFALLAAWFAANPSADFDGNTLIQVSDIFAFLAAWFAGC